MRRTLDPSHPFYVGPDDLPETMPVFPLSGVLLLPTGFLPLNIFEPRYLAMVDDALRTNRLIGMVQPKNDADDLYDVGCVGRIVSLEETADGRYQILLRGVSRFHIHQEMDTVNEYRVIQPDWKGFANDFHPATCLGMERKKVHTLLEQYFTQQGLDCDWDSVEEADDRKLMTCLSMVCPFSAEEKQALLEAKNCKARAALFLTMLEMAVRELENTVPPSRH